MTAAVEADQRMEEFHQHLNRLEELQGRMEEGDDSKPTPEERLVDAILSVAIGHDTVCQYLEDKLYREMGIRGGSPVTHLDDGPLNEYLYEVIELCARLAPVAIRRLPARVFAGPTAESGAIQSLEVADLDEFMRPIFKEANLGHRFEVRRGYEVYGF